MYLLSLIMLACKLSIVKKDPDAYNHIYTLLRRILLSAWKKKFYA